MRPHRRTWTPALLGAHLAVVTALVVLALVVGGAGADRNAGVPPVVSGLLLTACLGALVLLVRRIGARRRSRAGRWWAGVCCWALLPWTWTSAWLAAGEPLLFPAILLGVAGYLVVALGLLVVVGGLVLLVVVLVWP